MILLSIAAAVFAVMDGYALKIAAVEKEQVKWYWLPGMGFYCLNKYGREVDAEEEIVDET